MTRDSGYRDSNSTINRSLLQLLMVCRSGIRHLFDRAMKIISYQKFGDGNSDTLICGDFKCSIVINYMKRRKFVEVWGIQLIMGAAVNSGEALHVLWNLTMLNVVYKLYYGT